MTAGRIGLSAAVLAVIVYLIFPVVVVVAISFSAGNFLRFPPPGLSLRWYQTILSDPEWISALWVSIRVGALSAAIATLLGVPAAFALTRYVIPAKSLLSALTLCALVTPPIVTALSTYLFLVPLGLVNTIVGLSCVHAVSGSRSWSSTPPRACAAPTAISNAPRSSMARIPSGPFCASRCRSSRRAS